MKWVVRIKQGNGGKVLGGRVAQTGGSHRNWAGTGRGGSADLHRRLGLSSGTELRKRMATEAGDNKTCGVKAAQGLLDTARETWQLGRLVGLVGEGWGAPSCAGGRRDPITASQNPLAVRRDSKQSLETRGSSTVVP